jgi:methylamine--corrinoid protein Co-methyltransferase
MDKNAIVELACAGMTRKQANEVVKKLLPEYEDNLADAPIGKSYSECFNLITGRPTDEYVDFVENIKKKLSTLGISL